MATARRVSYVHSDALLAAADRLPSNLGRASLVHFLVHSFELLKDSEERDAGEDRNSATITRAVPATREELKSYHDESWLQFVIPVESRLTLDAQTM